MTVQLTDDQYAMVLHVLTYIAAGYARNAKGTHVAVNRDELVTTARRACVALGWSFPIWQGDPPFIPRDRRGQGDANP